MKSRLLLAILSCVLGLLAVELVFRLVPTTIELSDPAFFAAANHFSFDPQVGYVLQRDRTYTESTQRDRPSTKAVTVTTNKLGYRDDDFHAKWSPHATRIAVIGDSFAQGVFIENAKIWPRMLEKYLGPPFSVFNLGVKNYALSQYLLTAQKKLADVKPHAVVVGVYLGNDITSYMPLSTFQILARVREKYYTAHLVQNIRNEMMRLPHARDVQPGAGPSAGPRAAACLFPAGVEGDEPFRKGYYAFHRGSAAVLYDQSSSALLRNVDVSAQYMSAIEGSVHVPVLFVLEPTKEQVLDDWWATFKCLFTLRDDQRFVLREELRKRLTVKHVLDLTETFLRHQNAALYLMRDGHWDEEGHDLAARVVAGELRTLLR